MKTNNYTSPTVIYDHEVIANNIEGGQWIPVMTKGSNMIRNDYADFAWGDTSKTCTVCYDTSVKTYSVVDFSTREVRRIPTGLVRSYVKWAQNTSYEMQWGATSDGTGWITYPGGLTEVLQTDEEKATYAASLREERKNIGRNRLREVIKSRCFPGIIIKPSRTPLPVECDHREMRARETLRRVIGEDKWKAFTKNGFISVRAKSHRIYQIFPAHGITRVFDNGVMVERLCVVMQGNFPATDSLIMRYLMILNDEADFWKRAVKHGPVPNHVREFKERMRLNPSNMNGPLIEVAKRIRVA